MYELPKVIDATKSAAFYQTDHGDHRRQFRSSNELTLFFLLFPPFRDNLIFAFGNLILERWGRKRHSNGGGLRVLLDASFGQQNDRLCCPLFVAACADAQKNCGLPFCGFCLCANSARPNPSCPSTYVGSNLPWRMTTSSILK